MNELDRLRASGTRALAVACCLATVIVIVHAAARGGDMISIGLALALAAMPAMIALTGRDDQTARLIVGSSVAAYPMIFVAQMSGSSWQIDMHMTFFATLAMITILADWRPVLVGAVLAAVHHLATNYIAPSLVFPDGASLLRVVLHAVVVVAETGALLFLTVQLERLLVSAAAERAERERIQQDAAAERDRISREQVGVIEKLGERLNRLAKGDLTARINTAFPSEYDQLRQALNQAIGELETMVRSVTEVSSNIRLGSAEIRSASDDLSRRTEEQASAIERNSVTTRSLAEQITGSARDAEDLRDLIEQARKRAEESGHVVGDAVDAMQQIEQSAGEIQQIVTLIDGISFQTNLLALNAGVEAARAGDAGKGFAVVASEVRALAQRSSEAASTIRDLIAASATQVTRGVALVGETGEKLGKIVEGVEEIGEKMVLLTNSSHTHAAELRDVDSNFRRLDQFTQQNAAMVEQSNAAAHNLANESETLIELVRHFATSENHQETAAIPQRRAA